MNLSHAIEVLDPHPRFPLLAVVTRDGRGNVVREQPCGTLKTALLLLARTTGA